MDAKRIEIGAAVWLRVVHKHGGAGCWIPARVLEGPRTVSFEPAVKRWRVEYALFTDSPLVTRWVPAYWLKPRKEAYV